VVKAPVGSIPTAPPGCRMARWHQDCKILIANLARGLPKARLDILVKKVEMADPAATLA
jgi:hypothetical protein